MAVAAAVASLALAGGGYSDLALGAATAVVWAGLLAAVLSGRLPAAEPSAWVTAGAACLLALLGLTLLSLSWTPSDESAFAEAVRLAGYLGVFLLAGLAARPSRVGPVLTGIAIGGVLVALLALGSRLLGIGDGDGSLAATLPTASGRLSYPIGYWNALGAFVAVVLPVLCWIASEARSRPARALALAGFPPLLLVAYMTSSRGALIATAVGLAVAVNFAADRRHSAAVVVFGLAASVPAVVAATLTSGILDSAGSGSPGGSELVVLAALLIGMLLASVPGTLVVEPLGRARWFALRIRTRTALLAIAAGATLLILLAGPSALIGDLRSGTDEGGRTVGIVSASGSGRAQFWDTATDAFLSEPVRGIGAGGYESYWNRNGSLQTPARNAHSEPLELLAELGIAGLLCFLGFLAVVLTAAAGSTRSGRGGSSGAALGVFAAGLVGFAIDWTWQVPAVVLPILISAGLLAGSVPSPCRSRFSLPRIPAGAATVAIVALAVPVLWASGVISLASSRLDSSADALARGQLNEAAADARSAAAAEPWAAEPWVRLAEIEQSADNLTAAQLAAAEAIERAPDDVRGWLLATRLLLQQDRLDASFAYGLRAIELQPSD